MSLRPTQFYKNLPTQKVNKMSLQELPPTILDHGSFVRVVNNPPTIHLPKLEPATYNLDMHPELGYILVKMPSPTIPDMLYGDIQYRAERIINTFLDRTTQSTGVLLSGDAGSGKTLLAKVVCHIARVVYSMPTVIVAAEHFRGPNFNALIQRISQDAVIMFDEFEKTYDTEQQEELLTLFDGVYTQRKLFLITANDTKRIIDPMLNRPGRAHYHLRYDGLDTAFIREYVTDHLNDQKHLDEFMRLADAISPMSFDILRAIVEECNRWNEPPKQVMSWLNVDIKPNYTFRYKLSGTIDGIPLAEWQFENYGVIRGNPLYAAQTTIELRYPYGKENIELYSKNPETYQDEGGSWNWIEVTLRPQHVRKDLETITSNTFEFEENGRKVVITATLIENSSFNPLDYV